MPGGLLDQVRASCRWVAEGARFVRIEPDRLAAYAASIEMEGAEPPVLDPVHHYVADPEGALAFVLTLDAINFGSGYFPHLRKRPGLSGYFTIATGLKERFEAGGPMPPAALEAITARGCAAIFGQDLENPPVAELMGLFATALNDLGRFLRERHGGRFAGPVEAAGGSVERLVEQLTAMPFFRDVRELDGREVSFYKRAQLTAADLALAFAGEGLGRFGDLDRLTIFADNLVPNVLRVDGLLRYDPALAARIDAGELIPAGSREEVEIRAVALHAVELLVGELRARGESVTAMRLDHLLWNRGQQPKYKSRPRHRTRTVSY
jgi:hypothetical protein